MTRSAPAKEISVDRLDKDAVFQKNMGSFIHPRGSHLIERTEAFGEWMDSRAALNTWPYSRVLEKAPLTATKLVGRDGVGIEVINFGSQDYLGLSSHPAIHMAVLDALREYGPHTAASPILQGNTLLSLKLEKSPHRTGVSSRDTHQTTLFLWLIPSCVVRNRSSNRS